MAEDWDVYRCIVDDAPASIYLDLGIAEIAPEKKRPHLLRVSFPLQTPNADGLSDSGEAEMLFEIEDMLFGEICRRLRARYVGRVTTQGRRTHVYYGSTPETFEPAISEVQSHFPQYTMESSTQLDRDWEVYFDLLYPSDLDLQTIQTRRQVEALIREGDDVSRPRDIDHWLSFPSSDARQQFLDQIAGEGFLWKDFVNEDNEAADPADEYPHGLVLMRPDTAELIHLDGIVTDLFLRAQACGGIYTGWGKETQDE